MEAAIMPLFSYRASVGESLHCYELSLFVAILYSKQLIFAWVVGWAPLNTM